MSTGETEDYENLVVLTQEDVNNGIFNVMERVPYSTPGAFREDMGYSDDLCCVNCYDYHHPFARDWRELTNWLYMNDEDWRTVQ